MVRKEESGKRKEEREEGADTELTKELNEEEERLERDRKCFGQTRRVEQNLSEDIP